MRIFIYELKKLWNWRILMGIAALAMLVWFAFLHDFLGSYDSLTTHGVYGAYQTEMFDLYGETLEPDELADFDIPGKKAEAIAEMEKIIAQEPIFSENNIHNYEDFAELRQLASSDIPYEEADKLWEKIGEMEKKLENWHDDITLDEWYVSPNMRLGTLQTLEDRYVDYQQNLIPYIQSDLRPVVVRAAEQLSATHNANLINYDLCPTFSQYAATVAVSAVLAVIILIAPLLTTDRARRMNLLQYSSIIGRRIIRRQFAATVVSAFVLSAVLVAAAYIPFIANGTLKYWGAHIMALETMGMWLYNITFGQFVLILAGMSVALSVAAACFAFVLARFSTNIVTLMIKAVPVGAAVAAIAALAVNMALSYNNIIFTQVFHGRFDAPETVVSAVLAIIAFVVVAVVLRRERKVDVD
jgi:hypothetical protein